MTSTPTRPRDTLVGTLAWHPLVWLLCGAILVIATGSFLVYRRIALVRELVASAEAFNGSVAVADGGPEWLDEWFGEGARTKYCPIATGVDVDKGPIDDAWLEQLRFHPAVRKLSIRETRVRGPAFRVFDSCREIDDLNLWGSDVGDEGWEHFPKLAHLRKITAGYTPMTDRGLFHIRGMTELVYVGVRGNDVTDEGLAHIAGLVHLTGLYLAETRITDRGLAHLSELKALTTLNLSHTRITDAGLRQLERLTSLRRINLGATDVTAEGRLRLMQMLPEVIVEQTPPRPADPRKRTVRPAEQQPRRM